LNKHQFNFGKCLCGEVEIKIDGEITDIIHCHCSLCRKNSGTAFATNGFIKSTELEVVSGKNSLRKYSFKPGRNRYFCANCGSPFYSSNEYDPERYRIRLGIIDTDITERPMSHNFVSSKANWEDLDDKIPRYNSFEPNRK
jgi:hypothetical protein